VKRFSWIAEIPSQSAQEVVERIDKAYRAFFSGLKRKIRTSPPKFRKVKKYKSFTLKQAGYKFNNDGKIKIGTRVFKCHNSERKTNGKIKTVTVKRDGCGGYFLVIVTDQVLILV
jgi:putative transposase